MISKMFGDIWPNVAVVINFWDAGNSARKLRAAENITVDSYRKDIQKAFKSQIGELDQDVPVYFLDAHFTKEDDVEKTFFATQATSLFKTVSKMSTFVCLKREAIMDKIKESKGKFDRQRRREIKKQRRLKQDLETCDINLKSEKSFSAWYKSKTTDVKSGCSYGTWGAWGKCEAGKKMRNRAKLASDEGECELEETETEKGCTEFYSNNWLEDPDNVAYTFGGLLGDKGGEAGTLVYSDSKYCTAPEFPVWRQNMAAAYGPGQGIMACGGLDQKNLPTDECWVFKEEKKAWEEAHKSPIKLAGSTAAWYQGDFWLLGGSSSHQINMYTNANSKGQKYNPESQSWTEIDAGFVKPFHSGCVVNIDDDKHGETLFLTGGTSNEIIFDKKVPGRKSVYMLSQATGNQWKSYPNMKIARASHTCSVATIEGNLGVIVAGGTDDGDTVEFFDWEEQRGWTGLQRMGRQRGIGPGMAYIRGQLNVIGGYDWPYTVSDVETFNGVDGSWSVDSKKQGKRFNHVALTIPAKILQQCSLKKRSKKSKRKQ